MDIVYFDPGYGAGIDGVTCVENETYNPINGVAYTKAARGEIVLPVPPDAFVLTGEVQRKILTLRFSVYLKWDTDGTFWVYPNSTNNTKINDFSLNSSYQGFHNVTFTRFAQINTSGSFVRWSTIDIDNNIHSNLGYSYDVSSNDEAARYSHWITSFSFFIPSVSPAEFYISNVIVSTETRPASPFDSHDTTFISDHFPVKLPLKNTSGDFISLGDGEYLGDSAGQKLLSVVDAQDVIQKFGGTSKVSHLVSYGHPSYRDGANITSATGITEENSSIAAHGSCSLSTDTVASAAVAWAVDNTRLSDVDGMKIGWQV